MQWTPEGRRLVTGASSGEFTLWNGLTFNFETILQVCTLQLYMYSKSSIKPPLCTCIFHPWFGEAYVIGGLSLRRWWYQLSIKTRLLSEKAQVHEIGARD